MVGSQSEPNEIPARESRSAGGAGLPGQARAAIAMAVVSPNLNLPTWVGWVGGG